MGADAVLRVMPGDGGADFHAEPVSISPLSWNRGLAPAVMGATLMPNRPMASPLPLALSPATTYGLQWSLAPYSPSPQHQRPPWTLSIQGQRRQSSPPPLSTPSASPSPPSSNPGSGSTPPTVQALAASSVSNTRPSRSFMASSRSFMALMSVLSSSVRLFCLASLA